MSKIPCTLTVFFVAAVGFAQPRDARNCSVDGTVVNSLTGAPVVRAQVSIVGVDDTYTAESDSAGRWSVLHAACGRAIITVNRVGFLRTQQSNLNLIVNTPTHDVELKLAPQSVLAGRVLDDEGDAILGAQVSLMTSRIINGVRGIQASNSTTTNDLGEYRFSGLTAGKYILCANAGGGAVAANGSKAYSERCYPGPMAGGAASAMDLAAGYEGRVDFALSALSTVRVSGVVSGLADGDSIGVSLTPRTQIARMALGLSSGLKPDGAFSIRNVPPGSYMITARSTQQGSPMMARQEIEAGDTDIENVKLHLEPPFKITGTVKIVSAAGRKIGKSQYAVTLMSPGWTTGSNDGGWDDAGTQFTIPNVQPGNYRLFLSPPAPFYLKSATLGGRDLASSDVPIAAGAGNIEIVLSDDGGTVEGDVAGDDGPTAAWIFLEKDGAPSRNAHADANGHFKIDVVPPGDYKVYAWDDNTKVEYGNPDWMQRHGKAVALTVDSGQTAQVKLVRQITPPE